MPKEDSGAVKHDVFVSYANQDKDRVERLVTALDAEGWNVFWDQDIPPGKEWESWILPRLEAAAVIIPVWSTLSVKSRYVKQEADIAHKRGVLVPVTIDDVEPPFGFRHLQALNLMPWFAAGGGALPPLLKTTIQGMLSGAQTAFPAPDVVRQERATAKGLGGQATAQFDRIAAVCAALVIVGLVVFLLIRNEEIADARLFFALRVVLSFGAAVLGATIPGFLSVAWSGSGLTVRAGGALALFALTYLYTPELVTGSHIEVRNGSYVGGNVSNSTISVTPSK